MMKELIKKVLTDKAARNSTLLSTFLMTLVIVGAPWTK